MPCVCVKQFYYQILMPPMFSCLARFGQILELEVFSSKRNYVNCEFHQSTEDVCAVCASVMLTARNEFQKELYIRGLNDTPFAHLITKLIKLIALSFGTTLLKRAVYSDRFATSRLWPSLSHGFDNGF